MNCPNCGAYCDDTYHFCICCGAPLRSEPPAKKGSHRVPLLILVILSVIGIGLFFATEGTAFSKPQTSCFQVENGALLFHEEYYTGPTDVSVPEEVSGKTVRQIGDSCFSGCDSIITVYLPETIESIGSRAFEDCTSLRGILLPESVTVIGTAAFAGCSDLEAICIPYATGYIAPDAFEGCTSLNHIFYAGPYEDWLLLYGAYMDPNVSIHCADGNYFQGLPIP
ncbi:MAG: leucine-rich repeat domain-containing protein [Oscillospiraceae bacterium]|nr:leucine-rich repeat domain-containing protein [Oscillospiraceae bacterium]